MTLAETEHAAAILRYLRAVEAGATGPALAAFYAPDVILEEQPNRLNPAGVRRDLAGILAAAERGAAVIRDQRYDVQTLVTQGERVAAEVRWSGVLRVDLPGLAAGSTLRARFAQFFVLRDGRIASQRTYDCFEPW